MSRLRAVDAIPVAAEPQQRRAVAVGAWRSKAGEKGEVRAIWSHDG